MKKTGLAKNDAKKLMGKMAAPGGANFGGDNVVVIDRREQRKRDQALGLIPLRSSLIAIWCSNCRHWQKSVALI